MAQNTSTSQISTSINWLFKTIQIVATIALPIIGWVGMGTLERISQIEKSIIELRIEAASTQSSAFTSLEWNKAKQLLDEKDVILEKRLVKTEESLNFMKEMLVEIRDNQKEMKRSLDSVYYPNSREGQNQNK